MKKGYYTVECNNCTFITFWNGFKWIEEDVMLADFLLKFPVKIKRCVRSI